MYRKQVTASTLNNENKTKVAARLHRNTVSKPQASTPIFLPRALGIIFIFSF